MESSEGFCLTFREFENRMKCNLKNLQMEPEFCDVTIASEDKQIEAHKIILAGSSLVFKNILKQSHHPHPLIFLRGIKFSYLENILDFMYQGQVNIDQNELNDFLAVANDLKIDGLTEKSVKLYLDESETFMDKGNDRKRKRLNSVISSPEQNLIGEIDIKMEMDDFISEPISQKALDEECNSEKFDENESMEGEQTGKKRLQIRDIAKLSENSLRTKSFNKLVPENSFTCEQCNKSFANKWTLKRHTAQCIALQCRETEKSLFSTKWNKCKFSCVLCEQVFNEKRLIRKHMESIHETTLEEVEAEYGDCEIHREYFCCAICHMEVKHCHKNIAEHLQRRHNISLQNYEESHGEMDSASSELKPSKNGKPLTPIGRIVKGDGDVPCESCDKMFSNVYNMKRHQGEYCTGRNSLRRPNDSVHSELEVNNEAEKCNEAENDNEAEMSKNWKPLTPSGRIVRGDGDIPCDNCSKMFSTPSNMLRHQRKHCTGKNSQYPDLKVFLKRVDVSPNNEDKKDDKVEKDNVVKNDNEARKDENAEKDQVTEMDNDDDSKRDSKALYSCEQCDKAYLHQTSLNYHIAWAHNSMYWCDSCDYKTSKKIKLQLHLKSSHQT